jgi:hypothetical protein
VRTTITLDDDVTFKIQEEMQRSGKSFKETVNEALRVGLSSTAVVEAAPFRIKARSLGLRPGLSYDNVAELLEQIEGTLTR